MALLATSASVAAQGAALATVSVLITPVAPVLFSITTGWPQASVNFVDQPRGQVDGAAGRGRTTMVMGLAGRFWAKVVPR